MFTNFLFVSFCYLNMICVIVATATFSRANAYSSPGQYGLFVTCERKKKWLGAHTRYFTTVWLSFCIYVAECGHTWAAGMLLVLMRIGPPCLHVLSRLTVLLSSLDGTVYKRLHTLPTVTVWLGCLRFRCLASSFKVHTHTHTLLQVNITCKME